MGGGVIWRRRRIAPSEQPKGSARNRVVAALLTTIRYTFTALGVGAAISMLAALAVVTLVVDTPQMARWFIISAALSGASFLAAIAVWIFET